MKFCQLLEYNLRKKFSSKIMQSSGTEAISRPFSRKSLDQYSEVLYILFVPFAKLRAVESDWN